MITRPKAPVACTPASTSSSSVDSRVVAFDDGELAQHAAGRQRDASAAAADVAEIGATESRRARAATRRGVNRLTHKPGLAAALVAPAELGHVGVDLEESRERAQDRHLATHPDAARAGRPARSRTRGDTPVRDQGSDLQGSRSESSGATVGFTEVELDLGDDGSCAITIVDPARLPVAVEARWQRLDQFWLASATGTSNVTVMSLHVQRPIIHGSPPCSA